MLPTVSKIQKSLNTEKSKELAFTNRKNLTNNCQCDRIISAEGRIYSVFGVFKNIVFGQQGDNSVIGWQLYSITMQSSSVRLWADFFVNCRFSAERRRNGK